MHRLHHPAGVAADLVGDRFTLLVAPGLFTYRIDLLSIDGVKEAAAKEDLIADARRGASKAITLLEADEADLVRRATDPESLAKVRTALQATKAVRAALFSNPEPTDRP